MRRPTGKIFQTAIQIVEHLSGNPGLSRAEIEGYLTYPALFGQAAALIRTTLGDEVLVCESGYIDGVHGWRYHLAVDAADALDYISKRKRKVRNECANLAVLCGKAIDKYGAGADLQMAKVTLEALVNMLDVSMLSDDTA